MELPAGAPAGASVRRLLDRLPTDLRSDAVAAIEQEVGRCVAAVVAERDAAREALAFALLELQGHGRAGIAVGGATNIGYLQSELRQAAEQAARATAELARVKREAERENASLALRVVTLEEQLASERSSSHKQEVVDDLRAAQQELDRVGRLMELAADKAEQLQLQ